MNWNMLASHLEVGTLMILFAGPFLRKSSCKALKSFLSVYMLMDMRYKHGVLKLLDFFSYLGSESVATFIGIKFDCFLSFVCAITCSMLW